MKIWLQGEEWRGGRDAMEKCQRGAEKFQSGSERERSGRPSCSQSPHDQKGWKGTRTNPLLPEAALKKALPRRPQWDQYECPSRRRDNEQAWKEHLVKCSMRAVEGRPARSLMKKRPETWNFGRGSDERAWKEHWKMIGFWVAALARATRGERGWKGTRTDSLLPGRARRI